MVVNALEWVVKQEDIVTVLNYLDDFLIVAPAGSQCKDDMLKLKLLLFVSLRLPIIVEKLEGLITMLTFATQLST